MTDDDVKQAVKQAVLRVDPKAAVILYGSRARGDAGPDSDWDFLVLTESRLNTAQLTMLQHELTDIELRIGTIIVPVYFTKQEWASPLMCGAPFSEHVVREGVMV